jgi:hypothetical protein
MTGNETAMWFNHGSEVHADYAIIAECSGEMVRCIAGPWPPPPVRRPEAFSDEQIEVYLRIVTLTGALSQPDIEDPRCERNEDP